MSQLAAPTAFYISGPITGYPDDNRAAFAYTEERLKLWYPRARVINPLALGTLPGDLWQDYLRRDLAALLTCDAVATLSGWKESRGASLEVHVAQALGLWVRPAMLWQPISTRS